MHQLAQQQAVELFQLLVNVGAVPGEDFSFDSESGLCGLSDRARDLLCQAYPEIDWSDVFSPVTESDDAAIEALHAHLGIDFIPRILDIVRQRLYQLSLRQAAWYVRQVLGGVEQRTQISLYTLLQDSLDLSSQARLEYLLWQEENPEPNAYWMVDLVMASGGTEEDVQQQDTTVQLSEPGMRRLAEVWMGDYDVYGTLAS
jgi:hypothetical protein